MLRVADLVARADFRVGDICISPSRRRIEGPAGEVQVEPRVMQVFMLLIDAGGRVVTRNQIFDACWGGVMVGDDSLNRAIGGVRKIAAQVAPGAFEVETIPRTGYRLTGLGSETGDAPNTDAEPRGGRVSRRAMMASGGAVAVVAAAGLGLWAARPGRDPRFDRLVEQADQVLRYEYSPQTASAVTLLQQALAIDPADARARGLLAYASTVAATNAAPGVAGSDISSAEQAIRAALAIDPDEPNARLALLLLQQGNFDWTGTEAGLRRILAIAPRNTHALAWLTAFLQAAGRSRASWDVNEQLIRIDPIAPTHQWRKALKHWILGRNSEADMVIDRQMELWPGHPWVWNARFLIFAFTGRPHAALDMIDDEATRPATITPGRMAQWRPTLAALESPSRAAIAAAREANLTAARQSPGQAAYAVMALSSLGETDAAYQVSDGFLLSRGTIVTRRPSDAGNMMVNNPDWRQTQWMFTPPLAGFRDDPRFASLCDAVGLTGYWKTRGVRPDYLA